MSKTQAGSTFDVCFLSDFSRLILILECLIEDSLGYVVSFDEIGRYISR